MIGQQFTHELTNKKCFGNICVKGI